MKTIVVKTKEEFDALPGVIIDIINTRREAWAKRNNIDLEKWDADKREQIAKAKARDEARARKQL